jgi:hypothetical protein
MTFLSSNEKKNLLGYDSIRSSIEPLKPVKIPLNTKMKKPSTRAATHLKIDPATPPIMAYNRNASTSIPSLVNLGLTSYIFFVNPFFSFNLSLNSIKTELRIFNYLDC